MDTTHLYPLRFNSIIKEKIWGGRRIADIALHRIGNIEHAGESWDVSAMDNDESEVANGFLAENTINELIGVYINDLVGNNVYERFGAQFPLLVKIIDANDRLSVQVHPDDNTAQAMGLPRGKTEMWCVLNAEPGAYVYAGFNRKITPNECIRRAEDGTLADVLCKLDVQTGDIIYIPAGMVHAIGEGCLMLEIQQASDTTFRLFDYNRRDLNGQLRPLHIKEAIEAIDFDYINPSKIALPHKETLTQVVRNEIFTANTLNITSKIAHELGHDSFVLMSCLDGCVELGWHDSEEEQSFNLLPGQTVLIPAEMEEIVLSPRPKATLLEVFITD